MSSPVAGELVTPVHESARDGTLSVALTISSDGPGGAEKMILHLARSLVRRGHRVMLVTRHNGCGWLPQQFAEMGMPYELHSMRHYLDPRSTLEYAGILRRHDVNVIHSHEFTFAAYGALASRWTGIRHVVTFHGGEYFASRWRRRMVTRQIIAGSATVAVSGAVAARVAAAAGVPLSRIGVVANGVPSCSGDGRRIRRELQIADDEPVIVSIGNLYPVKGHRTLIGALAMLRERNPHLRWKVLLAGRGGEEGPLRAMAAEGRIGDRLTLLGFRPDVQDVLAAADLFVLPSLSEGMPLALIEAMAAAKAIVASRVGGIPEVVSDGEEAVLVPAGDAGTLSLAIEQLLRDDARRSQMGTMAQERARRMFTVEAMTERYERIYRA